MLSVASALQITTNCKPPVKITDAQWGVDSNDAPVLTVTFQGPSPCQAISKFKISPPYDWGFENAYFIYTIDPVFMNGYSSNRFVPNSTYVGSNPHIMQIHYNPRALPPSGTMVMISAKAYSACHRDNDDSELACDVCEYGIFRYIP
ncbi:hypothetical protein RhiirA4_478495 [Rhizophagus irregularis]|uniref:Uncharacterized protein n=1 Tax=Rhizophagus irregularis TaxID=588596 RepID=A0A2I1HEW7_9GLOM|nr:hypothetical protein RhiirA4_478495 [Rhizophagus irregularis]